MKVLLFVIALLIGTAFSALAAGNELGNGGDLVAQEFTAAGHQLVARLKQNPDPRIPDVGKLEDAVNSVKVTSAGHLTLHGAEVDAINYPEQHEIDVNRPRWELSDPDKRASLVLHEYLGILQVNDLHYEISSSYAEPFAVPAEKPKKFEIGLGTSYGWSEPFASYREHSTAPGINFTVGYALNLHTQAFLQFNRETFGSDYDWGNSSSSTFTELTAGLRYWLTLGKTWKPFVQMSAGYIWKKSEWEAPSNEHPGLVWHDRWKSGGNFVLDFGPGIRYALLRNVNLDLSAIIHNVGAPWSGWNYGGRKKNLTFNSAVNVDF